MNSDKVKLLVETVQQLSMARDLESIMQIVRQSARQLTGADGATFVLKDKDLCFYADEDAISPLWKGQRFPLEACISGWAMINKQAAVIPDIYQDPRIPVEAYRPTFVKSLVMVPIRTMDPIGAIGNYWAHEHTATEEELFYLRSLADITSVSIENVYVYSTLEQQVEERTRQLEEANKTLESFNYSVSHDLRAPLRAIQGYSGIVLNEYMDSLNEDCRSCVSKIDSNAKHMGELIAGLLEFSKMSGKELAVSRIDMREMVEEVCNETLAPEKNRKIRIQIGELPAAAGDALLIRQVWFNLISNAVKYSGKKETAEIEIGFNSQENYFFVKDNGDGFDMQYYHKLFGFFQRLHSQQEFQGNGVGLTIIQKIIARHGGKIWAEGKVGEGATFYFTLSST
jgi:hypothetical protein